MRRIEELALLSLVIVNTLLLLGHYAILDTDLVRDGGGIDSGPNGHGQDNETADDDDDDHELIPIHFPPNNFSLNNTKVLDGCCDVDRGDIIEPGWNIIALAHNWTGLVDFTAINVSIRPQPNAIYYLTINASHLRAHNVDPRAVPALFPVQYTSVKRWDPQSATMNIAIMYQNETRQAPVKVV